MAIPLRGVSQDRRDDALSGTAYFLALQWWITTVSFEDFIDITNEIKKKDKNSPYY